MTDTRLYIVADDALANALGAAVWLMAEAVRHYNEAGMIEAANGVKPHVAALGELLNSVKAAQAEDAAL